ncbi:MAG: site-specific integrase, partial [Acidobacteriota bacterium]|nr:site-specific integrase [Acidobacteriota bacterium]
LAPKTVCHIMECLRGALDRAVVRGVVPFNPARAIKPPEVSPTSDIYNRHEVAALVSHATGTWMHPAVLLLADCAMRPGEICALRWDDLTADWSAVLVRRSRNNAKGTTKTPAGCRDLALTARVRTGLKQWRTRCHSTDWIFPALNGEPKPLCVQTLDEHFSHLVRRAGVRRRRPYDLRHTSVTVAVTNAARAGVNLKDVARWAGHKHISTTLEIYTAAIGNTNAMAEVMELGWGSAKPQSPSNAEVA